MRRILKLLVGALLGLVLLIGFFILSYMPPDDPEQTHFRPAASQDYAPRSATYESGDDSTPYSYSLAFVELNDEGLFAESEQVRLLLADLKSKVYDVDTTILLYVHGWNHNASPDSENVACFEELLKATAIMQSTYLSSDDVSPRAVYGIYVGWPAVVYETKWLNKALTWFGRQSASDRVGERGALLELFSKIGELRDQPGSQKTKFVIISHSLGARLTYKSLRPVMQHSVYTGGRERSPFVADMSVMVNPALTADEHTALAGLIEEQGAQAEGGAAPTFVIATSESDEVLGGVFPTSQKFSSFFRGDYMLKDKMRTLPVGLFDEYVTHNLKLEGDYENTPGGQGCPTLKYDELEIVKGKARVQNVAELYDFDVVKHYDSEGQETYRTVLTEFGNPSKGPIMVIKVAEDIVPNHNDFYTSPFVDFVARVINARLYRSP
jgi:hypothetical protein